MPDEPRLREQAKVVIQSGKLPSRAPDRTWGGPGVGAPCSVCEKPVTKEEMEFEIQFAHDGDNPGLDKFTSTSAASPPGSSSGTSRHNDSRAARRRTEATGPRPVVKARFVRGDWHLLEPQGRGPPVYCVRLSARHGYPGTPGRWSWCSRSRASSLIPD